MQIGGRRYRPSESGISNQTIILAVTADPIPHESISVPDGQGTVLQTDANRVNVIFAFQLFELQTGVCRIGPEETVRTFSVALGVNREVRKQSPELARGARLH